MNLHEYQAKRLFADQGIPIPAGEAVDSVDAALGAASRLGGESWLVKAQVHAGGRGKGGGVVRADGVEALRGEVERLLDSRLRTPQTDARGLPVNSLLVEVPVEIRSELYLGALVDRRRNRVVFMASAAGGMNIEEVAARDPAAIHTAVVDPVVGLQPYQSRQVGFALGLEVGQVRRLGAIMAGMYRLFMHKDASLIEINPLVVTGEGGLLALDAKINLDDNALYRHQDIAQLRDPTQEDDKERQARAHQLNYITLDGDIACMVNGAGLAMATMDIIQLHGGRPANFLDVGGGTTAERVAEAFKLILSDGKVRAILVNIFGGIVRCDLIAEGIIAAVREVHVGVPVVVRLEGTNAEQGRAILDASGLDLLSAADLNQAAQRVVAAATGEREAR
jgi:succinyl-CoA synthetase beta subunit